MSTRVPSRPLRRRRDPRPWLALWCVLMGSVAYVAGWAFWSYTHLNLRVVQQPPGASALTSKGSPFRVLSMVRAEELAGNLDGNFKADEGMTFIVVRYQVTRVADDEICLFRLAGADGREYERSTKTYGRALNNACGSPVGVPAEGEVVFEVPIGQASRLIGLIDTSQRDWLTRKNALTPPS